MDSLVAECFKLLFVTMTIVFFLFVLGVSMRASYISDYREDITQTIQRYGGLTSAAIAKLNSDSAKYYDNSFTVDTADSDVGDAGYGDTVDYAVNVAVKAPFRVDFLKTTQSTVLFSGVMKGSAVSQVRKATSDSDVVDTASTTDSNFADNYNANNINVGSTDLQGHSVDSTDQFESSDYMAVTPGKYVFATAFFGSDQSDSKHNLQVAYYDSNKHLLGYITTTGSSLSAVSAGLTDDPLGKSSLVISNRYVTKMPSNAAYIKFGVSVNKQSNGTSLLGKDYSVFVTQEDSSTAVPSYTAMPDVSWAFKPQLSASASSLATAIENGSNTTSASEAAGTAASGYDQYWVLGRIVEPGTSGYSVYVSPLNGSLTNSNLSSLMFGYDTTVGSTALSTASGFASKFEGTVPLTQYSSNMGSPSAAGLVTGLPTSSDVYVNSNLANNIVLVGALNSSNSNFTVLVNPFATASSAGN
jgi:hypothetical protein